jgi:RNase P subunit RPR2
MSAWKSFAKRAGVRSPIRIQVMICQNPDCEKPITIGKGCRNAATEEDQYPYCSHECALRMYWKRDQHEALNKMGLTGGDA